MKQEMPKGCKTARDLARHFQAQVVPPEAIWAGHIHMDDELAFALAVEEHLRAGGIFIGPPRGRDQLTDAEYDRYIDVVGAPFTILSRPEAVDLTANLLEQGSVAVYQIPSPSV